MGIDDSETGVMAARRLLHDVDRMYLIFSISCRAERAAKNIGLDAGITTAPLSFNLPGGFGVALQHTQEVCNPPLCHACCSLPLLVFNSAFAQGHGTCLTFCVLQTAGGLSKRTHPTLFSNRKAAIFFQGCLTNVDELLEDLLNRREAASSYGSDGEPMQLSHGDQGHISAQIILEMYLRTGSDSDRLAMLLSDLQVSLYAPRIWNCLDTPRF